jgi:hypothetical protein
MNEGTRSGKSTIRLLGISAERPTNGLYPLPSIEVGRIFHMERMPEDLIWCSQGRNDNGCLKDMQEFREINTTYKCMMVCKGIQCI